ncbi:UNVERIFIED_CONTAM: hypothetical protein HDU68_002248 [Siphonaria sp. JEL0065]|nr:hypothetical protein HDU68_002248 [Siphonaria sp. JEL0065]
MPLGISKQDFAFFAITNDPLDEGEVQDFITHKRAADAENWAAYMIGCAKDDIVDEEVLELMLHPIFDMDVNRMNLQLIARKGVRIAANMRVCESFAEFLMG